MIIIVLTLLTLVEELIYYPRVGLEKTPKGVGMTLLFTGSVYTILFNLGGTLLAVGVFLIFLPFWLKDVVSGKRSTAKIASHAISIDAGLLRRKL